MKKTKSKIAAIVLAAGQGTRLKKRPKGTNKVAVKLNGKPMIAYTLDILKKTGFDQIIAVVGYASDSVREVLGNQVDYAVQPKPNGTGDAAEHGLTVLKPNMDYIVVMYGDDTAFYQPKVIQKLIDNCVNNDLDMTFLTAIKEDATGIGRIVRDKNGVPSEVVEEKVATPEQKKIKEGNLGMYCFKTSFIKRHIKDIDYNPIANERYLTDIVAIAYQNKHKLDSVVIEDKYWFGVNTDEQLEEAKQKMAVKNKSK